MITVKRSIFIPIGAGIFLFAAAFMAGRLSIGEVSPTAAMTPDARISPRINRSLGRTDESSQSPRMSIPAGENALSLLNQLARKSVTEDSPRSARPVLVLLEQLSRLESEALPSICKFLSEGEDVTYVTLKGKRLRDVKSLTTSVVPYSLRFALFDVVAESGTKEAEAILVENLDATRSSMEVAYLSQLLEKTAPGTYRDAAITAATNLLKNGDASDRNLLFEVMRSLGDTSYVATAQREMIQPDGQIDRAAMRYLQQALGQQSVALAAQAYQDSRLREPGSKEPLARVALTYVGANAQALDLYHNALMDQSLLPDQKRELVEDLNQDGISNSRNPTPEDLQIIAKRYELTQAYLQQNYVQSDATLNAAFHEADKDLRKMLEKAAAGPR